MAPKKVGLDMKMPTEESSPEQSDTDGSKEKMMGEFFASEDAVL